MSNSTFNHEDDLNDEILIDLKHLENNLSLMSKLKVRDGEQINPEEMNSLFDSMRQQVNKIIIKFESTM